MVVVVVIAKTREASSRTHQLRVRGLTVLESGVELGDGDTAAATALWLALTATTTTVLRQNQRDGARTTAPYNLSQTSFSVGQPKPRKGTTRSESEVKAREQCMQFVSIICNTLGCWRLDRRVP